MKKIRPAVVISDPSVGKLPFRLRLRRASPTVGIKFVPRIDFVVLVLSPPRRTVLSETVLVLDGGSNCGDTDR